MRVEAGDKEIHLGKFVCYCTECGCLDTVVYLYTDSFYVECERCGSSGEIELEINDADDDKIPDNY